MYVVVYKWLLYAILFNIPTWNLVAMVSSPSILESCREE